MTFVQRFPCLKILGSIFCVAIYIGSFASKAWVVVADDTIQYGLWTWCYTNFTDQDNASAYVNDTRRCHWIAPGDSPGYYEGVRTMACFTLVTFLALLMTFDENNKEGWGVEKRPCIVAWTATLLSLITVGLLGDKYHGDERWKDLDPQLGWCFWLAMSACILVCLLGALGWLYDEMKKSPSAVTSTNNGAARRTPARPPPSAGVDDVRAGRQICNGFCQIFPCIKIVGSLICVVVYIVSFASKAWVVVADHTIQYGLWTWCYTNFTDHDDASAYVNDTRRCHWIAPGDSPGYYEGVRTMACFTLVGFLALFGAIDENNKEGWGVEKRPCIVAWTAAVLSVITLALIGGKYTGDERWKDLDPELGWCFWLAMCACILVCLLGALGWIYDEMKKSPPAATSTNNGAARRTPARPPPSVAVVDVSPESQTSSSSCSRNVRCIKLVGCIVLVAIYITCFANKAWVVVADQTIQYGLWTWCYTKFTHKDNASAYVNDEGKCHWIAPGDSPGYYEGVRTMACFTLVAFLALFGTIDDNNKEGWGVEKRPCIVAWTAAVLSVITLALLGGSYHGDERWKDLDPELGWCFWLAMSACILVCLLGALGWIYDEMKKSPSAATSTNNGAARRTPARPPPSAAGPQTYNSFCQNFPCIKLVGSTILAAIYIASFASKGWVVAADQTVEYGLWTWCYTKFTDKENASAYVDDKGKCHWIAPGDSPGYYEGVRTMACFTLVAFLALFGTIDENNKEGWGVEKRPCIVAWTAAVLSVITLALLGVSYHGDKRWKDLDPQLGWCFWLAMSACILVCLLGALGWLYDEMKKSPSAATSTNNGAARRTPARPPPSVAVVDVRRGSQTSSSSSESETSVCRQTAAAATAAAAAAASSAEAAAAAATAAATAAQAAATAVEAAAKGTKGKGNQQSIHVASDDHPDPVRRSGSGGEFPLCRLPPYDIPLDAWSQWPNIPPPSYEEAVSGRHDDGASPPQPVLVPDSPVNQLNTDRR